MSKGPQISPNQNPDRFESTPRIGISPCPGVVESNDALPGRFRNPDEVYCRARFSPVVHAETRIDPELGTASGALAELSQRGIHESPEYVATTESHVGRSKYLGSSEICFHEEMVEVRGDKPRLSRIELELLRVQGAFELPQRSMLASLVNSYFQYCSPWTPILDASSVDELQRTGSSPLLLNALLLAGSRVTMSNVLSVVAEDFYCKARLLFMLGHKKGCSCIHRCGRITSVV